jgi:hypothetical protein
VAGCSLVAACQGGEEAEVVPEEPVADGAVDTLEQAATPAFSTEVRTQFEPTADDSPMTGSLRLLVPTEAAEPDTPLRLNVSVSGLAAEPHAWNVYDAPCSTDGPMLIPLASQEGDRGIADPLQPGEDGRVEVEVPVPPLRETWVEAGNYSVRILEPSASDESVLACATL